MISRPIAYTMAPEPAPRPIEMQKMKGLLLAAGCRPPHVGPSEEHTATKPQ